MVAKKNTNGARHHSVYETKQTEKYLYSALLGLGLANVLAQCPVDLLALDIELQQLFPVTRYAMRPILSFMPMEMRLSDRCGFQSIRKLFLPLV